MVDHGARTGTSRGQGRQQILDAAAAAFAEKEYAQVTTREIARRAGISEPMLFRHFGSKSALFQQAAAGSFTEYMRAYCRQWEERGLQENDEVEARAFYAGLYEVLRDRRDLLRVALFQDDAAKPTGPVWTVMQESIDRIGALQDEERARRGYPAHVYDFPVMIRLMFGMALSVALHGEWLFGEQHFDLAAVLDEMARLTVHGGGDGRARSLAPPARRKPAEKARTRR
ncbi:MAG TPA: helix-turn-helix domain-containing protein [Amycolatopsis sp.]|nr:helix-turn-helix domain-containing protein [Amycolatopsis sp.]